MATTTYTLTCLSPVHVGSGRRWSKFDGAYDRATLARHRSGPVLACGVDPGVLASEMSTRNFSWAEYLRRNHVPGLTWLPTACRARRTRPTCRSTNPSRTSISSPTWPAPRLRGPSGPALLWHLMPNLAEPTGWADFEATQISRNLLKSGSSAEYPTTTFCTLTHVGDSSAADRQGLGGWSGPVHAATTGWWRNGREAANSKSTSSGCVPGTRLTVSVHLDEYLFRPAGDVQPHFSGPRNRPSGSWRRRVTAEPKY